MKKMFLFCMLINVVPIVAMDTAITRVMLPPTSVFQGDSSVTLSFLFGLPLLELLRGQALTLPSDIKNDSRPLVLHMCLEFLDISVVYDQFDTLDPKNAVIRHAAGSALAVIVIPNKGKR